MVVDIARYIRKGEGTSGWYEIGNSDKLYKAIYRKVAEAKKKIGDHGIDIHKLESISAQNAARVVKRKYSSMTSTRRQNIGLTQNQMEKQVIEYIRELQSKNKRVTRVINFRKVIELFPMLKAGFIWDSNQGDIYVIFVYLGLQENYQGGGRELSQPSLHV